MYFSKYGAKKTEIDGIKFDSKLESEYYLHIKELKAQGIVKDFECHPRYRLLDGFTKGDIKHIAVNYSLDFKVIYQDGREVLVDIKGMPTSVAKLKRKFFDSKYPDIELQWLVRYRGERVTYESNEARKRENRKIKKLKNK